MAELVLARISCLHSRILLLPVTRVDVLPSQTGRCSQDSCRYRNICRTRVPHGRSSYKPAYATSPGTDLRPCLYLPYSIDFGRHACLHFSVTLLLPMTMPLGLSHSWSYAKHPRT